MRRAKIVCTLGPASSTPERLAELVAAGYGVESVDGHRQLEEVFMSIVDTAAEGLEDTDEAAR